MFSNNIDLRFLTARACCHARVAALAVVLAELCAKPRWEPESCSLKIYLFQDSKNGGSAEMSNAVGQRSAGLRKDDGTGALKVSFTHKNFTP